jgi:zinc and cadmium transporter
MAIWYTFLSVLLISLVSFVGAVTLFFSSKRLRSIIFVLVSLSVGALFGDVFIHLLPEMFTQGGATLPISLSILAGILFFFVLEKFLRWHHHHDGDEEETGKTSRTLGYLNLISDGAHNFLDGAFIAGAFLVSVPVGMATTLAVLLHEVPQEIGDFGILLHAGFKPKEALLWNAISALVAFLGVILILTIGPSTTILSQVFIPFTAGSFLYIAGSDLVPELHRTHDPKSSVIQFFAIVIGILLMASLLFI